MLQNAYLLAKISADTAENEQQFAEILPTDGADGADGGSEKRYGPSTSKPLARTASSSSSSAGRTSRSSPRRGQLEAER